MRQFSDHSATVLLSRMTPSPERHNFGGDSSVSNDLKAVRTRATLLLDNFPSKCLSNDGEMSVLAGIRFFMFGFRTA
jgi:hypothetical protein